MNSQNALDDFKGKNIKVVYFDSGATKVRKGLCLGFDDDFVSVQTFQHCYAIPRRSIAEIKTLDEEVNR